MGVHVHGGTGIVKYYLILLENGYSQVKLEHAYPPACVFGCFGSVSAFGNYFMQRHAMTLHHDPDFLS